MAHRDRTYISVFFDQTTIQHVINYIQLSKIPNPVSEDDLHCTLILDDEDAIVDYVPICNYTPHMIGVPYKLDVWKTLTGKNCLVLIFKCKALDDRHDLIVQENQSKHYYPQYISHITLSYDIGDLRIDSLPNVTDYISKIIILGECNPNYTCYDKEIENDAYDKRC